MGNIELQEARALAIRQVDGYNTCSSLALMLVDDFTKELESGWLFFYNTKDALEGKSEYSALLGSGPIFVERSGKLHELPTYQHWSGWLTENGFSPHPI